jgi:Activator of Hsp90 ATPase homolog 1-like protein
VLSIRGGWYWRSLIWVGSGPPATRFFSGTANANQPYVVTSGLEFGCDSQGGEQLGTLVLTEHGSKTMLTLTVLYPSKEARDATIASGMEHGVAAGYDRLEELLASTADQGNSRSGPR